MKNQRYATFAITPVCLIISTLALANTDFEQIIRSVKFALPGFSQTSERVVERGRPHPKDPVDLSEVKVQGKVVRIQESFLEDGDWIKKTTFTLKNKSSKTISYIHVDLDFPETQMTGLLMVEQLLLGRHPVFNVPEDQQPLNLQPGESLVVSLAPKFDQIKKMIEYRHTPIGSINKILIRLNEVGFEDETLYSLGELYKRNPDANALPKWIKIE